MSCWVRNDRCAACEKELPPNHSGPCPHCGKQEGKKLKRTVQEVGEISENLQYSTVREFYEENPTIKKVVLGIALGSPFVGFALSGPVGVAVGLGISVFSYMLGPRAVVKVREIRHGSGK